MKIKELIELLQQAVKDGTDPDMKVWIMCEMENKGPKGGFIFMEGTPTFIALDQEKNQFVIVSTDDDEVREFARKERMRPH
jgi:hypothetical protein